MQEHYKLYEGYAKKANECRKILSPLRAVSVDYTFVNLDGGQLSSHRSR